MDNFIQAFIAGIDRTLLRENLLLTPQQRFEKFDAFMQGVIELKRGGEQHRAKQESMADNRLIEPVVSSIDR